MDRREFLKATGGVSTSLAVGGCFGPPEARPSDPLDIYSELNVVDEDDITTGVVTGEATSEAGDPFTATLRVEFITSWYTDTAVVGDGVAELGRFEYDETKEFEIEPGDGDGELKETQGVLALILKEGTTNDYDLFYSHEYIGE